MMDYDANMNPIKGSNQGGDLIGEDVSFTPERVPTVDVNYKDGAKSEKEVMRQNNANSFVYGQAVNSQRYLQDLQRFYVNKLEQNTVRNLTNEQRKQQFIDQNKQRDFQIQNQLQAFGRNFENVTEQLNLNRFAANRALNEQEKILNDRLLSLEYDLSNQDLNFQQGLQQSRYQYMQAADSFANAQADYEYAQDFSEFQRIQEINRIETDNHLNRLRMDESKSALGDAQRRSELETRSRLESENQALRLQWRGLQDTLANQDQGLEASKLQFDTTVQELKHQIAMNDLAFGKVSNQMQFNKQEAGRQFDRTKSANEFGKNKEDRDYDKAAAANTFGSDEAKRNFERQDAAFKFSQQEATREYNRTSSRLRFGREEAQRQFDRTRAEAFEKQQQNMLQNIQSLGASAARGQRGGSAQRTLDTITALSGLNQATINNSILRADTQRVATQARLTAEDTEAATQRDAVRARLGAQIEEQKKQSEAAQARFSARTKESEKDRDKRKGRLDTVTGEQRTQRDASQTRFDDIRKFEKVTTDATNNRLRNRGASASRKGSEITGGQYTEAARLFANSVSNTSGNKRRATDTFQDRSDISDQRKQTIKDIAENNKTRFEGQLGELDRRFGFTSARAEGLKSEAMGKEDYKTRQARMQRNKTQNQNSLQADQIAAAMGITKRRYEMDRRTLGRSILSAMSSYETAKDQIFLDKYAADVKTYAQRMFQPSFIDGPSAPFTVPPVITTPPARPIEVPKASLPSSQSGGQSGFGKALVIGGAVLSAAATGGLSLGAMGVTLGSGVVGGIGAGMTGLGGFI